MKQTIGMYKYHILLDPPVPAVPADNYQRPVVVFALKAPGSQSLVPERQRRTFWTACASCNKKEKYPIEDLNRHLVCHNCNNPFIALEVPRPRNQGRATTEIMQWRAMWHIDTIVRCIRHRTTIDPVLSFVATISANVAPPGKKVKMEGNVAHGEQWTTKALKPSDITLVLKDKGKRIVENLIEEIKHAKAEDDN